MRPEFASQIAPMFDLSGRVALVTGGAIGIGHAGGLVLAAAGATVILTDDEQRLAGLMDDTLPSSVETQEVDVKSERSVERLAARIDALHGGIDILVNAAVMYHNKPTLEIGLDEWDEVQAVNVRSAFLTTRAVVPLMRKRGGGRIINITTIGSVHPVLNGNGAYSASRAGLNQFTRNCALDFAPDGITANALLPGAITVAAGGSPNSRITGPGANPARHLGGSGNPQDVAGMILLLSSQAGRYISGQTIAIDGGFLVG